MKLKIVFNDYSFGFDGVWEAREIADFIGSLKICFVAKTVKNSFSKLSNFLFPNCQKLLFQTVKSSFSKLSKILFETVKNFFSKLSKIPFPN
jgi:hypothetical protein